MVLCIIKGIIPILNLKLYIRRINRRLSKDYLWPIISPLYIDYNPDYSAAVFLAGTEKSGTTWVSDLINYKRDYRYVFEPFWSEKVDICKNFTPQQYIRPDDPNPHFLKTAQTILSGKIRNAWTDRYHRKFIANKRLIKDIRSNLFLKWIKNSFPEVPIILLIRHPCAVAASHLRRKHLEPGLDHFLAQENLVHDFLLPFKKEMEMAKTKFDKLIFRWCIQNYIPLKQFHRKEIALVFYEVFCEDPMTELEEMFSFLDIPYDKRVFRLLKKPSPVAREKSAIISGGSLIDSWRQHISKDQIERAIEILSMFGLDKIYTGDSMPDKKGAFELLGNK